jgi:hypothetical protein
VTDTQPTRRIRVSDGGRAVRATLFLALATLCLIMTTLAEWPGSAVMRLVGSYSHIGFLVDASPADAIAAGLTLVAALLLMFVPTRRSPMFVTYAFCAGVLIMLLVVQAAFGPPENADSWNTRFQEISRTSIIFLMYFVYFRLSDSTIGISPKIAGLAFWSVYASGLLCFAFAVLQSTGHLNNLYFQWYVNAHLPRPAGGFSHPHYFAASCVIAAAAVMMMARRRYLSAIHAYAYTALMLVGAALSTSRVGLISAAVALLVYVMFMARRNPSRLFAIVMTTIVGLVLAVLAIAVLSEFSEPIANAFRGVTKAYEVFTSVFGGDGQDVLRGRGAHWSHEIEVITNDPGVLFFGYGFQPYVSHNLFLRQLQVTGIIGTIAYTILLVILIIQTRNRALPIDRDLIWVTWTPIFVSLNTLPILTSVTLNAAVMLIATLATLPHRAGRARFGAQVAPRSGAGNFRIRSQPQSV